MARVLCVWELGANLGHLSRLLVLAERLRTHRHEVIFAVRDVNAAAPLLRERGFPFVASPDLSRHSRVSARPPINYAEILEATGFCDQERLSAAVSAWRSLFALLQPAALLLDHAPTALLAARGMGIPRLLVGGGFFVPPRRHPFPDLRPWTPTAIAHLEAADNRVREVVNAVCRELGLPPLDRLHDLFDAEENFLCTFPELDHCCEREPGARYCGPISLREGFSSPAWPSARGPRIFVYLRPSLKNLEAVLSRLASSGASVLAYVPGLSDDTIRRLGHARVHFAASPVDLVEARRCANLAVTYAGPCATTSLLLGGAPVLMFPQHLEQYLFARRVAALGAGVIVERVDPSHDYAALISRMASDESLLRAAQEFAQKHRDFDSDHAADTVASRIEAYLYGNVLDRQASPP